MRLYIPRNSAASWGKFMTTWVMGWAFWQAKTVSINLLPSMLYTYNRQNVELMNISSTYPTYPINSHNFLLINCKRNSNKLQQNMQSNGARVWKGNWLTKNTGIYSLYGMWNPVKKSIFHHSKCDSLFAIIWNIIEINGTRMTLHTWIFLSSLLRIQFLSR